MLNHGYGPILPGTAAPNAPLKQQVFECVRSYGQIARIDVAKHLGVSPASITAAVSNLISDGLIDEEEANSKPGHRGRPPVALSVRAQAHYVIGIKFSEFAHTAAIFDLAGNLISHVELERAETYKTVEHLLSETNELIKKALSKANLSMEMISGIGVGLPGVIDHGSGHVHWSPLLSDRNVALASLLERHFGVPTEVDNDANLLTLAELWFGRGRAASDFAVITVEQGVGMGLVIGHELYRGAHSVGMEIGHTKVHLDGALCRCGQRGCLEAYISDYAIAREAITVLDLSGGRSVTEQTLLNSLYAQAKAGNAAARHVFHRAGRYMALGLANVINLFDPSLIILSGQQMRFEYLYADKIMDELASLTITTERRLPNLDISPWGDQVWARGAATLALSALSQRLGTRDAVQA